MTVKIMNLPAKGLINNSVSSLSLLQVHENLFWGSFWGIVEADLGQVLGTQPQEDCSANQTKYLYKICNTGIPAYYHTVTIPLFFSERN